jgi:trk system potassium uptake protein TrkH
VSALRQSLNYRRLEYKPAKRGHRSFRLAVIARLFGLLLMLYSFSFLPSIGVSLYYHDGSVIVFINSLLMTFATGLIMWWPFRNVRDELSVRDGFLVVTLFWVILGMVGALPFMFGLHLSLTDAMFESVSGFTTTGASVFATVEHLPHSILYHRQQIQFLGGMGIIVLAVAILPLLGVGGMQLYRAEASGVTKEEKLTPRIAQTARVLWLIYFVLTLTCILAYWTAGMSLFDAVGHAYATVATGGFSTHDASIGYWNSPVIESISILFMLAGGINFTIHFYAWRSLSLQPYEADPEVRAFLGIFVFATVLVAATLYFSDVYAGPAQSFRYSLFQVASVITSTGFVTANFAEWPLHIPLVMVVLSFMGSCVGSTAGGIKVMRIVLLAKLGLRQLFLLAHPRAVAVTRFGNMKVPDEVLFSVWGFYVLYIVTTLVLTLINMAAGLDLESALGAVMATINLLGPGLGKVSVTFAEVNSVVKWVGIFGMLVGRLELFTLLILFMPSYWRN